MSLSVVARRVAAELAPRSKASRVLYRTTVAWLLIGALQLVPLAADGWNWSGAVSWRKPIVFSFSVGLLLATIGWVMDRIPIRGRSASVLAWTFALSSSLEVGLITLQTWRGRASHFNVMEPGDATIFALMGAAVGIMSLCIVVVFVWSIIRRPTDRLVRIAVLSGLALVVTALGLGNWIIGLGVDYVERFGAVPDTVTVGEAGVAKFPHAVALHGIQLFIIYALLLGNNGIGRGDVARMYTLAGLYAMVVALVVGQTVAGLPPTDLNPFSVGVALLSAAIFGLLVNAVRANLRDSAGEDAAKPADMLSV